ncbi:hypothetical protein CC1G_02008 [Coprinopsis cinerea okayama7|uniref:Uncharacterized protein n=1 Tax=Coprinopsis cinerea (strain Okayama-7 / 130 / ATCC MYA-4618 / FGSC 9003) TaxID=240176 RepID=A8N6A1_COPC7|nr:hypothetical protein CC1G_02008 [Coprinopsis cinerea okayama7\|eukprot:XP_001830372.1 hypothetical protein CC1G_02008 [Coprinopsis cinerea okayama7\
MAAKFCCCLPLRLGVFIFTLFQFLVNGASAAFLWFVLFSPDTVDQWHALAEYARIAVIVIAAVYSFVSLTGLLGFLGALFRKNGLVKTYYAVLWIEWLFQIGSGIWFTVTFFRARRRADDDDCDDIFPDEDFDFCEGLENLQKVHPAWVIAPLVVSTLITAYVIYVTHHYIKRLKEQKESKNYLRSNPAYVPVQQKGDEGLPLTQPQMTYPYTDGSNSFGSNKPATNTAYDPVPVKTTV